MIYAKINEHYSIEHRNTGEQSGKNSSMHFFFITIPRTKVPLLQKYGTKSKDVCIPFNIIVFSSPVTEVRTKSVSRQFDKISLNMI